MYYVGVDYHKRYSVATVLDSDGVMRARKRLDNRLEAFRELLEPYDKAEIEAVVEATRSWGIPVDILEQLAGRVILANPGEVKLIAKGRISTDKVDSLALAKLLRVGWVPEAYLRPRANREQQLILRVRCFFVQLRTRLKNRIHDLIDRQDEPIRETAASFSDLFGKKGMVWLQGLDLSHPCGTLLCRLLAAYDALDAQVRQSDRLVGELFAADEDCRLLVKTPASGPSLPSWSRPRSAALSSSRTRLDSAAMPVWCHRPKAAVARSGTGGSSSRATAGCAGRWLRR